MFLRRRPKDIHPIDLSPKATPEWTTFKTVPPTMIMVDGIRLIASHVGKPLNQFVRGGLDIKLCLLRDRAITCPEKVELELHDGELVSIQVVQMKAQEYKRNDTKIVWRMTNLATRLHVNASMKDLQAITLNLLCKGRCYLLPPLL
ncbi:hypothetical protein LINPERPRIM_LOCUS31702 [Linum perenne]